MTEIGKEVIETLVKAIFHVSTDFFTAESYREYLEYEQMISKLKSEAMDLSNEVLK